MPKSSKCAVTARAVFSSTRRGILALAGLLAMLLCPLTILQAQELEKVPPAGSVQTALLSRPMEIAREVKWPARDFSTFRDPRWSLLTIAQIGAASADAVTTLNNFHSCPSCREVGVSRIFVGSRPDAHKYIIAGMLEIGIEAVTAHYFRNHGPVEKWYWRALWSVPQSLSLYEHARASQHNAALNYSCYLSGPPCR